MAKMKKIAALILSIMMLCCVFAMVAGCSDEEQKPVIQNTDDNSSENTSPYHFYLLQQAYNKGLLTQEDLLSIAYYNHNGNTCNEELMDENYTPIAKPQDELSDEQINAIKQSYANEQNKAFGTDRYKPEYVRVGHYCGTYDAGIVCAIFYCEEERFPANDAELIHVIAGVKICYPSTNYYRFMLWTGNVEEEHI